MILNKKYLALFLQNWAEACRAAKRLNASQNRLSGYMPISGAILLENDEDLFEKLDAFRVRFATLQDCLGNKLFRNLLRSEDEEGLNMADTLSRMEKRRILSSVDEWRRMREIRNAFSHDYPESENDRAQALTTACQYVPVLLGIMEQIQLYMDNQHQTSLDGWL